MLRRHVTPWQAQLLVTLQGKPIKVEIIGEPLPSFGLMNPNQSAQAPPPQMSLIERLGMTGSKLFVFCLEGARSRAHP